MRVVSLVPSWTETLIECGVDVVGRTRFCIHPAPLVKGIPAIGGTKDWDLAAIEKLQPDLVILDREENPKWMSEQLKFPWTATHVESASSVPSQLQILSAATGGDSLRALAARWEAVLANPSRKSWDGMSDFPGLLEWGLRPTESAREIVYVIWKNPWMAVSNETFIGSMLDLCGFRDFKNAKFDKKYPEIKLENLDSKNTVLLFSSEPFPFLKNKSQLRDLGFSHAFVDGESFSWFGIRSLNFLENALRAP